MASTQQEIAWKAGQCYRQSFQESAILQWLEEQQRCCEDGLDVEEAVGQSSQATSTSTSILEIILS